MGSFFLKILNQSIMAAICAAVVILLRFVLKKCGAPKWINGVLWALVGIRLILPFSLTSVFSLQPSAKPLAEESFSQRIVFEEGSIAVSPAPQYDLLPREELPAQSPSSAPARENSAPNPPVQAQPGPGGATAQESAPAADPIEISPASNAQNGIALADLLAAVWLCGVFAMLLYALIAYLRLAKKVAASISLGGRVYSCDEISSPFILGVFRPRVFIPSGLHGKALESVLAHENAHLSRRDHLIKPISFLLFALHWFNPLMLVSYILVCRDIELACDEKVIRAMTPAEKADYSETLLAVGMKKRLVTVCPLAFGEVGVKERVKSVLNYKKPAFWVILAAVVACAVFAVCFLTSPAEGSVPDEMREAIERHIVETWDSGFTGRYCTAAIDVFGSERNGDQTNVYFWEYYREYEYDPAAGGAKFASSHSHPAAAAVETAVSEDGAAVYRITDYKIPRDGEEYADSVSEIFPERYRIRALEQPKDGEKFAEECDRRAQQYFKENGAPVIEPEADSAKESIKAYTTGVRSLDATLFYEYFDPMECDNEEDFSKNGAHVLPVKRISSKAALDAYFAALHGDERLQLMPHELYFEHPDTVLSEYGEGFFKKNELFIVGIYSPSSDRRYELSEVINNYYCFCPTFVEEAYNRESDDFRFYLYFIGVEKGTVPENRQIGAQMLVHQNPGTPPAASAKTAVPVMPDPSSRKRKLVAPITPIAADSFEGRVTELAAEIRKNWGRDVIYNGAGPGYRQVHFASAKDACAYLGLPDLVVPSYPYETGLTTLSVYGSKDGAIKSVTVTTTENVASAPEREIRVTSRCEVITDASSNTQWECVFDEDSDLYDISMLKTASGAPYLLDDPSFVNTPEYGTSYAYLSVNEAVYSITVRYEGEENHSQAIEYIVNWANEISAGYAWKEQTYKIGRPEDISSAVTSIRTLDATAFYDYFSEMQGDNVQPYSSAPYVPVKRITSQEELEAFFAPVFADERIQNWQEGSIRFENPRSMLLSYDGWFFRESELFVIAIANSDKSPRYAVKEISVDQDQFSAHIYEEAYPYLDEALHRDCRLYFIGVKKGEIAENAALSAKLERYMAPVPTRSAAAQEINPLIVSQHANGSYTVSAEIGLIAPGELTGRVNEPPEVIRKQYEHPRPPASGSTLPWSTDMTFANLARACAYVGYSGLIVPELSSYPLTTLTAWAQENGTIADVHIVTIESAVNNPQDIYVQSGCSLRTTASGESPFMKKSTDEYLSSDEPPREAYTANGVKFYYVTSVSEKGWKIYTAILALNNVVYTVGVRYHEDAFAPEALDKVYHWADRLTYGYEGGLIPWEDSPQAQAILSMEASTWAEKIFPLLSRSERDHLPVKRFSSASEFDEFMEDAAGYWWNGSYPRKRLSAAGALSDAFFEQYDLWIVGLEAETSERRFRFRGLESGDGGSAAVFEELRYSLESPEKDYPVDYFCFLAVNRAAHADYAVTVPRTEEIV